jgi:hypothetical protein
LKLKEKDISCFNSPLKQNEKCSNFFPSTLSSPSSHNVQEKKVGAITLNGVSLFVQSFLILSPGGGLWRRLRRGGDVCAAVAASVPRWRRLCRGGGVAAFEAPT